MTEKEKSEKLFQAIEKINQDLIDEAAEYHPKKQWSLKRWIPIAAVAAVLMLTLSLIAFYSMNHAARSPAPEQKNEADSKGGVSYYLDDVISSSKAAPAEYEASPGNPEQDKTDDSSDVSDEVAQELPPTLEADRNDPLPQIGEPMVVWLNESGMKVRLYQISREAFQAIKKLMEKEGGFAPAEDPAEEIMIWIVGEDGSVYSPCLPIDDPRQGSQELFTGNKVLDPDSPEFLNIIQTYVH